VAALRKPAPKAWIVVSEARSLRMRLMPILENEEGAPGQWTHATLAATGAGPSAQVSGNRKYDGKLP
jgi:hypothetical protein